MNEAQTKYDLIDPALKKASWGENGSFIHLEFPITQGRLIGQGRREMPLKADYVLEYNNRFLGVIEAKRCDEEYTKGVAQAKEYAKKLNIRFAFSTNGLKIYIIDMQEAKEKEIKSFPTPKELWQMCFGEENEEIKKWEKRLFEVPYADKSGTWNIRYYQHNAVTKVLQAIAKNQKRILLTLATGTGKTSIAFQIVWKLFKARWNINKDAKRLPRILFLADRNILTKQALNDFNSFNVFEDEALTRITPKEIRKKGSVPKNASVFFAIFQTFMSGDGDMPYFGEYEKDFFDFIIIDECHRGGAHDESSWRRILEYFSSAVELGLTATPKRNENADTYKYFGEPVFTYKLKDGINDGFLTPFRVKEISTTLDTYIYTPDDTVIGDIEEKKEYQEADFNKIIQIKQREENRVKIFMDMIDQNQKTIVFCANQLHALAIRDLINQYSKSKNVDYCQRVTADDGEIGENYLKDFQDNERSIPTILTTSQKLSTGVDTPELRNIVLMRPINSMIEFKQIIGRGTRLFDGKDYFTIYDFVKAHKLFLDPQWDGEPIEPKEVQPKICKICHEIPCICEKEPKICPKCNKSPCICEKEPKKIIIVKLGENRIKIDSMVKTHFFDPSGMPISATMFIQSLFGDLPLLFKDENELRAIWSLPSTRKELLEKLSEKGYSEAQLNELKSLFNAKDSDIFDILIHVAYNKTPQSRTKRANNVKAVFNKYSQKQQEFLNFVLEQYIKEDIKELDESKLPTLLKIKYQTTEDAKKELGEILDIRETFIGFQEYLYREVAI